jgi:hypothetical protein
VGELALLLSRRAAFGGKGVRQGGIQLRILWRGDGDALIHRNGSHLLAASADDSAGLLGMAKFATPAGRSVSLVVVEQVLGQRTFIPDFSEKVQRSVLGAISPARLKSALIRIKPFRRHT